MPRKTKEEAAQTRQTILDVALDVFSEKGYVRTTLNDIAEKAGFTRGAVYWHFKDKADLFTALAIDVEQSAGIFEGWASQPQMTCLDDLGEFVRSYLKVFETNERYRKFYHMIFYRMEWSEELTPIIARYRRDVKHMISWIEKDFRALKGYGEVRADLDPHLAALMTHSLIDGVVGNWLSDPDLFEICEEGPAIVDELILGFAP